MIFRNLGCYSFIYHVSDLYYGVEGGLYEKNHPHIRDNIPVNRN